MRTLNNQNVCNALYLTPQGKLWDNHDVHTINPREHAEQNLAVHIPTRHPSDMHMWKTWGVWCGVHAVHDEPTTSQQRRSRKSTNTTFANMKTDRILDEYIKTCDVPLHANVWKSQYYSIQTPSQQLKRAIKTLNDIPVANSSLSPTVASKRSDAPLDIQHTAKQVHKHIKKTQNNTPYILYQNKLKDTLQSSKPHTHTHNYNHTPKPYRLNSLQSTHASSSNLRPTVSHPWYIASYMVERIETFLEAQLANIIVKSVEYKKMVTLLTAFVRVIVTRGALMKEWVDERVEYENDMLDVAPSRDSILKRQAYEYATPERLIVHLNDSLDMLFRSSTKQLHLCVLLQHLLHKEWWYGTIPSNNSAMKLSYVHQLAQHIQPFHTSEQFRKEAVKRVLPNNAHAKHVELYNYRYEQLVRLRLMSETAFRKEMSIMSVFYHVMKIPSVERLLALNHQQRTSSKGTNKSSVDHSKPQKRTISITLNANDRVPQKVNVKHTKTQKDSTQKSKRMVSQSTKAVSVPSETSGLKLNTDVSSTKDSVKKENGKKKDQKGGGIASSSSRVITLNTNKQNYKKHDAASTNSLIEIMHMKRKDASPSIKRKGCVRYLTDIEVQTYKDGLTKHIKQNGGAIFIQEQRKKQQKKHPGFAFEDIVAKSHDHHESIKHKLSLSAKNRNALRRVKRSVLKDYGGKNTLKNVNAATTKRNDPTLTSLYTRKKIGGDQKVNTDHRVTWNEKDSLGEDIRDISQNDGKSSDGLTTLDLSNLEQVHVEF